MKDIKKKLEENHIATIDGITSVEVGLRYKDLLGAVLPLLREIKNEHKQDLNTKDLILYKRSVALFLDYLEELLK